MFTDDNRVHAFILALQDEEIKDINNILRDYDDSPQRLRAASDELTTQLRRLKNRMETYLNIVGGADREVLKRMIIFALRDDLQDQMFHASIRRSALFGVEEREFKRLFGYDLKLETFGEGTPIPDRDNHHGPARDYEMDPLAPRGYEYSRHSHIIPAGPERQKKNLQYQYSILENFHNRLSAIEQRLGVHMR